MVNDLFIVMFLVFLFIAFTRRDDPAEVNTFSVLSLGAFVISLFEW